MTKAPIMRNVFALTSISFALGACGGGGGSDSPSSPVPTSPVISPPVLTPPVVVPPVAPPVTPPVTPPVAPPSVVPPPVLPPVLAACAAPTSPDPVVMVDRTPMSNICSKVYLEPGVPAADELHLRQSMVIGIEKVAAFYGGSLLGAQADAILCKSPACRSSFLGTMSGVFIGAGGKAVGGVAIMARPTIAVSYSSHVNYGRGTIAHEMAHVELNARIQGGMGVPAWFNEGQASINDEGNLCGQYTQKVVADLRTLDSGTAWSNAVSVSGLVGTQIYCQANREVTAWLAKNGQPAFLNLLAKVKAGTPFYTMYGALLTQ